MRIDENAPVTARGEISVAASRDVIWDLLTTMDRWAAWNPDVKTATQPELAKGAEFRWKAGPAALTSVLAEVDRPHRGVVVGSAPRLLPGVMRKSLQKTLDSWLSHLKTEAKARTRERPARCHERRT